MATEYRVELQIVLEPVGQPWVSVVANGQNKTQQLTQTTEFNFNFAVEQGTCNLAVHHFDKTDNDPSTAVIIKSISFFGIEDLRFVWAGVYRPDYPAHYPDKIPEISSTTYLGWNGTWQLNFDVPVFTWIHRIQNLGWIYQ